MNAAASGATSGGGPEAGTETTSPEGPRPLTETGLSNLVVFTRLLGYVRHFHPSDEAARTSWDRFAVEGVRAVEDCPDRTALIRALEGLFVPVAPTVQIYPSASADAAPPAAIVVPADTANVKQVAWHHIGAGQVKLPDSPQPYESRRFWTEIVTDTSVSFEPVPPEPFVAELGAGITARIPLALYADAAGTLPRGTHSAEAPAQTALSANDRATRLAAVALGWNVFQHFFPYFDIFEIDWKAELPRALRAAAIDPDEKAFLRTLRRMVAALRDGHGRVALTTQPALRWLPLAWQWVEDELVVTEVLPEAEQAGIAVGDVVREIDGKPVAAAIAAAGELISSATPQWTRFRAVEELARGEADASVRLRIGRPDSPEREVSLGFTLQDMPPARARPQSSFTELKPGIFYVDIDRATSAEFEAALPQLEMARGIIFDLRGYPNNIDRKFLQHLSDRTVTSARWQIPFVRTPDQPTAFYMVPERWQLEPLQPRLRAKIAFLTDGRAISYAESVLGLVEGHKLGDIVGATTAGTNGNLHPFALPGGYEVGWTGMRVIKHDGSDHHGQGISPTVPVSPTIRGIAEGRDEVLERAVDIVSA